MSKLLKQIVTDGTKKKSGQNKTIRITLDIEYYEKIKLFCERYNRNLNGTIKDVLEEFVDEIEKSDPLYNTMINTQEGSGIVSLTDHKKKKVEKEKKIKKPEVDISSKNEKEEIAKGSEQVLSNNSFEKEQKPEKSLSAILLETIKK